MPRNPVAQPPILLVTPRQYTTTMGSPMPTYALALDVGSTFTDVMLMHRESGQLWTAKTPFTPSDPFDTCAVNLLSAYQAAW